MDSGIIVAGIGLVLTNASVVIAAWIKVKTDITAINVRIVDIDVRVKQNELYVTNENRERDRKLEKFTDINEIQHNTISEKIDTIKESLSDLKVEITRVMAVNEMRK